MSDNIIPNKFVKHFTFSTYYNFLCIVETSHRNENLTERRHMKKRDEY